YMSLPLAFWGQTPGMAASGLRAADGDRQLAFSQTTLRWLAAWLTLATIGLPWFLARSGRPLADRISRSETLVWEE
ncbi:MAG: RDD family protein, partial [Acidobacteriota bacterium]